MIQTSGLFGLGWSTKYDESLVINPDDKMIKFNAADGRGSFFGRPDTTSPFKSFSSGADGQIVKNADSTYTLFFHDGRSRKFDSIGKLLWQKDRNGNQTTLNYNTGGVLTGITDAVGRTLTISMGSNGKVSQISDSMGTVATYEYYTSTARLKTVTYNDGSKYKFEYDSTTVSGKYFLTTVKDVYNNILEKHEYDTSSRATTSERHGGEEKFTFSYGIWHNTYGSGTLVTEANGHTTTYFHTRTQGTNIITGVFGDCSCGSSSEYIYYEYDESNSLLNLKKKRELADNVLERATVYTYDSVRWSSKAGQKTLGFSFS